jgi:hypothetical protein
MQVRGERRGVLKSGMLKRGVFRSVRGYLGR